MTSVVNRYDTQTVDVMAASTFLLTALESYWSIGELLFSKDNCKQISKTRYKQYKLCEKKQEEN